MHTYEKYRKWMKEKEEDRVAVGKPPYTKAQKAQRLIAVEGRALQEIRYYQRGNNPVVSKAFLARLA